MTDFNTWSVGLPSVADGVAGKDIVTSTSGVSNRVRVGTTANDLAAGNHDHSGVYQPVDTTLTALAGVTTAANKLIYATALDTFSTTDLTVAARALLDDVDSATMLTTLGAAASSHTHNGLAPTGGSSGQVLKKNSNTNYDYSWATDLTGGGGGASDSDGVSNLSSVPGATVTAALDTLNPHNAAVYNLGVLGFALDGTDAAGNTTKFAALLTTLDDGTNYTGGIIEIPAGALVAYSSPLAIRCNTTIRGLGELTFGSASGLQPVGCAAIVIDGSVKGSGGFAFRNAFEKLMIWPKTPAVTGSLISLKDHYLTRFKDIWLHNDGPVPTEAVIHHINGNYTVFDNFIVWGPGPLASDYQNSITYQHDDGDATIINCDIEAHDTGIKWIGGVLNIHNPYIERARYPIQVSNSTSSGALNVYGGQLAASGVAPCFDVWFQNGQPVNLFGVKLIEGTGYAFRIFQSANKSIRCWGMPVQTIKDTDTGNNITGGVVFNNYSPPAGGTTAQVLTKASNTDGDFIWTTISSGGGSVGTIDGGTWAATYDTTVDGGGWSATYS